MAQSRRNRSRKEKVPAADISSVAASKDSSRAAGIDWQPFLFAAGLVIVTLIAYIPALNAAYIWDDNNYVYQNPYLQTLGGLYNIWFTLGDYQYYPLTITSFWLEYRFWAYEPFGYHLNNVLLHAANALLLWRVLSRLRVPGAAAAALLFALHPVHVESVAWVTERKNTLSGLFYFVSMLAYLRWEEKPDRKRLYVISVVALLLSLLCKTVTASLPAVLLLIAWWRRGTLTLQDWKRTAPYFILGVPLGLVTVLVEKHHVGADGLDFDLNFLERILIAGRAVWFYAGKIVWPDPLIFFYPRWVIDTGAIWQWFFPISLIGVLVAMFGLRKHIGRAPLTLALFFCGTLFPALGFIDVYPMRYSFVADHFAYLGSLGVIVGVCAGFSILFRRVGPYAGMAATAVVALVFAVITWRHCHAFENHETLYMDIIEKNPTAWIAYNNLGRVYYLSGDLERAAPLFEKAVEIYPEYPEGLNNIGVTRAATGDMPGAIEAFRASLAVDPNQPMMLNNLGQALANEGKLEEATEAFEKAISLADHYTEAYRNLAKVYRLRNMPEKAAEAERKAGEEE